MNELRITSQFKKDLKRYKHNQVLISKLETVLNILEAGETLPEIYRPHILTGNYRGHMECHIESDTLLIWWDKEVGVITLVRLGSHSELF